MVDPTSSRKVSEISDPVLAQRLEWQQAGTEQLLATASRLTDAQMAAPSLLPGWSRAHVLGHLARNCDALRNVLTWARTGIETPMYSSPEARDADIETTAALPPAELREDLHRSIAAFDAEVASMTEAAWNGQARTRQGRLITGAEVPWMRCREVWVHTVDLDAGFEFEEFPEDVAIALLSDACAFAATSTADVRIVARDADFERTLGAGDRTIEAPLADLLPWVLGRQPRPEWPALPVWL